MIWDSDDLPAISTAADACVQFIIDKLTDERGVHLETAINMAGSLAGVSILRSAIKAQKIELSNLIKTKPGSPVFVDKANDIGQEVTEFMVGFCKPLGINQQTGWTNPIPEDDQPLRRGFDLVRDFEKPFTDLMDKNKLKPELRPFAAGLAAVKLISMGTKVLNPDIGKAIALTATVVSSKTVPSN
jgi:hypothetical protein